MVVGKKNIIVSPLQILLLYVYSLSNWLIFNSKLEWQWTFFLLKPSNRKVQKSWSKRLKQIIFRQLKTCSLKGNVNSWQYANCLTVSNNSSCHRFVYFNLSAGITSSRIFYFFHSSCHDVYIWEDVGYFI